MDRPLRTRAPRRARLLLLVLDAALVVALAPRGARADDWLGQDKALHFTVSGALAASWYTATALLGDDPLPLRASLAFSLALVPGLLKEIYDGGRPGNRFSGQDMAWNVIGAATATLVGVGIELLRRRWRGRAAARRSLVAARPGLGAAPRRW